MSVYSQQSALDDILTTLVQYLNISHIRRHLKQAGQLTDDEYEQLDVTPSNPTGTAIERLVMIMKRKPNHEYKFLCALKRSMEVPDPHSGHDCIIHLLEKKVTNRHGHTTPIPIRHYAYDLSRGGSPNDSGISRDSTLSESRSEYTVSPSSWTHRSSPTSSYEEYHVAVQETGFEDDVQPHPLESRAPQELAKFDMIEGSRKSRREVESLRIKVARDSEEIIASFAQLVLAVFRLLSRRTVNLEEVRMLILFTGCCRGGLSQKQLRMFNDSSDIARAPTLSSLIQSLRNYSSWFNYRLIKSVAEEFGGDDGKKLIEDYENKLKLYFETVIAYQCPQFSLSDGIPEGYEVLEVKVDWDYRTCPLQNVVLFQATLSELLGLEPHVFLLKSLEEGCVLMKWAVPAVVAPKILTEVYGHTHKLAEVPVVYVQIMGKCIEITGDKEKHVPKQSSDTQLSPKGGPTILKKLTVTHSTASTGSYCSMMSELTSSTSKRSSQVEDEQGAKRVSQLSQIMDIAETADEVEILSNYSGHVYASSSSLAASRPSGSRLSDEFEKLSMEASDGNSSPPHSKEAAPVSKKPLMSPLLCSSSRPYHSEVNLLELTPTISHTSKRRTRAMSEDLLQMDDEPERGTGEAASVRRGQSRSRGKRKGPKVFKWIPHLFRPFRRRHCDAGQPPSYPPKQSPRSSPPPSSFPILPLSMEPCAQQGFHYYHTDKDMEMHEQGKGPPGYPEQREAEETLWIPQLYINSAPVDTPVEPDAHDSGTSCKTLTISELASSVSSQECDFLPSHLPLPVAGSSSRSISPSSPSSGYGGSSAVISMEASPSASMSPQFTSQLSEENESDHFSSSPSESHRFPRLRTNSAPYRLHGVHRKPSVTKGSDEVCRNTPKRNHSTNASDYRSISPAKPMCRETSDYFSTSDIGGSSIPHTPTSHYDSQTISEDSFVLTPTMQRKQFPEYLPVRRHSMNSRSRYQVPTGSFPLSVSSHGIVQPETS